MGIIAKTFERNRVFLAPMSGVTDEPFRALAHELGAGLVALPAGIAGIPPAIFGKSVDGLQEAAQ